MNKEINIDFTGLTEYLRDKDREIEEWRYRQLRDFKEKQHYKELLLKIKEYCNDYKEVTPRLAFILELLNEIE